MDLLSYQEQDAAGLEWGVGIARDLIISLHALH
jgi:hypothetical protein